MSLLVVGILKISNSQVASQVSNFCHIRKGIRNTRYVSFVLVNHILTEVADKCM